MGKHTIEGHEIDVADVDDFGGAERVIVNMTVGDDGKLSASVPTHPTKSILAKLCLGSSTLPKDEYWLLIPPAAHRTQFGLSEIRPWKNPYTTNDFVHQMELFDAIGRIAVFGGHVEMAMKKVLITLRGGDHDLLDPSLPGDWDGLEKELRKLCDGSDQTRLDLLKILDDAEQITLRDKRNDAIHGYWWLVRAHDRLINARYYRPKKGTTQLPVSIYNKADDVRAVGIALHEMAGKLEALVTPHWPIAFFGDATAVEKKPDAPQE